MSQSARRMKWGSGRQKRPSVIRPQTENTGFQGTQGWIPFSVTVPDDYNTTQKQYPVYYFLHGRDQTNATFHPESVSAHQRAMNAGKLPPCIVISPDSFSTGRWQDTSLGPAESNFMELIPYIEANYRVRPGAAYRLLGGFSMGGHGSFRFGLKYRTMFAAVWSVDGAMSYTSSDYTQYASGRTSSDFHLMAVGGNLNGSRVSTVISAMASSGITIPYQFYPVDHVLGYFVDRDQANGWPVATYMNSRLGIAP